MAKQILTLSDTETEKNTFYLNSYFLGDVDIKNIIVSNNISFGEKVKKTLLVTCMMIMKLSHYI